MRAPSRAAFLVLVLFVPAVHAGQGYVGAGVGGANVQAEIDLIPLDETALGFKLFGGYRFTDHFGLEFGYADFGSQEATQDTATLKTEISGWTAVGTGVAPIGERFELFGKAGLFFAATSIDSTGGFEPFSRTERETELTLGAGGAFKLRRLAIRVELEYFGAEAVDSVYMLSAGLEYRF
jgi:OOP family OmpA-OmpF porin